MFGTIAGAGIPPSAALSPGIPSSAGDSKAPPAHSGCRHPNISHPGSSVAMGGRRGRAAPAEPAAAGAALAGTVTPMAAIPAIVAATAVVESLLHNADAVTQVIRRSFKRGSSEPLWHSPPWQLSRIFHRDVGGADFAHGGR
jgi:hypothetical protein